MEREKRWSKIMLMDTSERTSIEGNLHKEEKMMKESGPKSSVRLRSTVKAIAIEPDRCES